ncbi:MarR family winged helix-turn-helix transcriptional regulator [Streptomyces prunicolor]|uniref:MarR family winged helix-turn-helix transcriptional regulator n=1 Tax=Streptomyces prunicolor TaxID=67348 RepID=UPI0037D0F8A5
MHKRIMDPVPPEVPEAAPEDLIVAVERMVRYVRQSAVTGGLSMAASAVLGRLGSEGPCRLTDLARAEGATQPNMTQLVTRLERADLVRRTADRSDGRGVLVEVTDTGLEVSRQRRAERAHALGLLIAGLSEPEQRAVRVALPALARAIEDRQPHS